MNPIDLTRRRLLLRRRRYTPTDLANAPSVADDYGTSSPFSLQRLPPVDYPIGSTDQPNPTRPYMRYRFNPRANIAEAPSVVSTGADIVSETRSILPQELRQKKRLHRQSHIPGPLSSNLPAVLNFQKQIQRFSAQRIIPETLRNFRRALRGRS